MAQLLAPVVLPMLLIYVRAAPEQPSAGRLPAVSVLANHQGARCVGSLLAGLPCRSPLSAHVP